jgi:hypothetical protein
LEACYSHPRIPTHRDAPATNPTSGNYSSKISIKTATEKLTARNGPAANRFRSFSVNNKATKPHPADPVPVALARVAQAVQAKVVPVVRAKGIAPDLVAPVRADSLDALRDNLLVTHWQQYSMQMAMV